MKGWDFMNYFEKNKNLKDFLVYFLIILAMALVIFNFIGVSEGATHNINNTTQAGIKETINGDVDNFITIILEEGEYSGENNTNISIAKNVIIRGNGSSKTIINGGKNQIFYIEKSGNLTLSNVTLLNGESSQGRLIYNNLGNALIKNSILIINMSSGDGNDWGGAIYNNKGSIHVYDSEIIYNDSYLHINYIEYAKPSLYSILPPSSYNRYGYNESNNVILEFFLSPASDPHFGGVSQLWIFISLHFKEDYTPIPNQIIHMVVGNRTFTYMADENGSISDIFVPEVFGYTEFQFLFNGSFIQNNGSIIYLEPVSAQGDYFLSKSFHIITIWDLGTNPNHSDFVYYTKNITINESEYDVNNIAKQNKSSENTYQIANGDMKKTGAPLIQLILSLIVILSILRFKK